MDSLTQIVLGASVAEAALGKKIGNRAILWGAIAGTIPDLDVFTKYFTDEITSTHMHRGFSHSIIFAVLFAFFLAWLVKKNEKLAFVAIAVPVLGLAAIFASSVVMQITIPVVLVGVLFLIYKSKIKSEASYKSWTWMFFLSLFTHPLLDAHTTWGTQLFWPFEYRVTYKNIFVADPLYTVPFLILLIMVMFYKRTNPKRTKINKWALIISTSYMALTFVSKGIGYNKFSNKLAESNTKYVRMDTKPTLLNAVLWNAQVETETGFLSGYYSLSDTSPITFQKEILKNHHLLVPYLNDYHVDLLVDMSNGWYYVEQQSPDTLVYTDIRFGQLGFQEEAPYMWKYNIIINKDGTVTSKRKPFKPKEGSLSNVFSDLTTRIKGI